MDAIEMRKGVTDFAAMARHYFVSLRDEGFDTKQALALTLNWQAAMLANNKQSES